MSSYRGIVLADDPALVWPQGADEISGTDCEDISGNGRHGTLLTGQVEDDSGFTKNLLGGVSGGELALRNDSYWTLPSTQNLPGTGIRADNYKPFVRGSDLTMETWCYKIDPWSFATMFSADGGSKPTTLANGSQAFPRSTFTVDSTAGFPDAGDQLIITGVTGWVSYTSKDATHFYGCSGGSGTAADNANVQHGVGAPHPTLEWGGGMDTQMVRWYSTVNTYPVGWMDWGTANTNTPRNDFKRNSWQHIAFRVSDSIHEAELFINGHPQGAQDETYPLGGSYSNFDLLDAGNFQIGFRGGPPFFPNPGNSEVWGGLFQYTAVYEYLLSDKQIMDHWKVGTLERARLRFTDFDNAKKSLQMQWSVLAAAE